MLLFTRQAKTIEPYSFQFHILHPAIIQLAILVISNTSLVTPNPMPIIAYSFLGYWLGVFLILLKRHTFTHPTDVTYLKSGYLYCLAVGILCAAILLPLRQAIVNH
jgi:hypothetical protein